MFGGMKYPSYHYDLSPLYQSYWDLELGCGNDDDDVDEQDRRRG